MTLPLHTQQNIAKNDSSYTCVELSDHNLQKDELIELVQLLKGNNTITVLNLQRNNMTSDMMTAFAGLPATIQSVLLAHNNLDDKGIDNILTHFKTVVSLDLSFNCFSNVAGEKLANFATQARLKVIGNEIDEAYLNKIAVRVQQNRNKHEAQVEREKSLIDSSQMTGKLIQISLGHR